MDSDVPSEGHGVSVVVTCYNLERYIGDAIRSVLNQRNRGLCEIIVVDDCSLDASPEIIQSFPEVKYIQTPSNEGVLLAMLRGVEAAQYDIVSLLDGDDLWEEGKLAATRRAFASDPLIALASHDLRFIDAAGNQISRTSRPAQMIGPLEPEKRGEKIRLGILTHDDYVWLGSALSFRRGIGAFDDFAAFSRSLPDPRNCYQDWPLAYWIAARGCLMAYIDEPLFCYRLHGQNHSGDASTPERTLRNFSRARNTIAAMCEIAEQRDLAAEIRKTMAGRLAFAQAQVALYAGDRFRAVALFIRSLPTLMRLGSIAKETVRFGVGATFGPTVLTKMASRNAQRT